MTKLEIVRALVAKADSTPEEGERRVFREKAEQLISKYGLKRDQTGIDGPRGLSVDDILNDNRDFSSWFRQREEELNRQMKRDPGNRYTSAQLYEACRKRRLGWTWNAIGMNLGIKATGHLSKTLRDMGYLEDFETQDRKAARRSARKNAR